MKRGVLAGSAFLICVLLTACRSSEDAMLRGDRYWADSNYVAALAEYRLAARQGGNTEADARVAHAYIKTGQLERARNVYDKLIKTEPGYEDQAVFDYVWLARTSLQRGDRYGAARAAEAALLLRPGLPLKDMSLTVARHYGTIGDTERALAFYRQALNEADDSARAGLLYEVASLSERNGDCVAALPYFRAFTDASNDQDSVTEARWRMGTCGFERGRQARAAGDNAKALDLLQMTLDLGAPQNLLDQAWFEKAEALDALGRPAEAATAFERVIELAGPTRGPLAGRAERRLQEIRSRPVP